MKTQAALSVVLLVTVWFFANSNASADDMSALVKQGRSKAQSCTRCHGRFGIQKAAERMGMGSAVGAFAQRELGNFKIGLRQNPIMSSVAQSLTDDDVRAIVAWLDSIRSR